MTTFLIVIGIYLGVLLVFGFILPNAAWSLRYLFQPINYLHWWMLNPTRFLYKNFEHSPFVRKTALWSFRVLYVPRLIYYAIFWVLFTPLRVISSFYYNLVLFYSLTIRDNVLDWMGFKRNKELGIYSIKQFFFWVGQFFTELPNFVERLVKIILQGLAMFVLDCVIPAITVYHGTSKSAVDTIVKNGKWIAGRGDYGGLGIYFGIKKDVAAYYGLQNGTNARIILTRISIPFIRTLCTIPEKIKISKNNYRQFNYPLKGGQGKLISIFLSNKPSKLTELWRAKQPPNNPKLKGWYELCIVEKENGESYVELENQTYW